MVDLDLHGVAPERRPFRFGLILDSRDATRDGVVELARRAEGAGVSVMLGTDHLGRWATLPLLQSVAEATGLRIGTFALNNDLRHPAVVAQELSTIDAITAGRLEVGLGAGWNRAEYEAAGLAFDRPGVRLQRMQTSFRLLRQAMTEGRMEHAGDDVYPPIDQQGLPRSFQRPHPPLMVGGGGPRLLAFAAQEADIVGLDPRSLPQGGSDPSDISEAAIDRKIGWIRDAAGDRWRKLEINIALSEVAPRVHSPSGHPEAHPSLSAEEVRRSPHRLVGESGQMIETLLGRRERWGISYIALRPRHLAVMAPVIGQLAGT